MINLAKRNLKLFFRQKSAVLFCLLGVFIIIGLYVVFLGDVWTEDLKVLRADNLMNHWIIAGIVSVTSLTTTMGAFGILVEDRVQKLSRDFQASPLKRSLLVGGYILCAYVVGLLMSLLAFGLGGAYILWRGGELLTLSAAVEMFGSIVLSTLASSTFIFFIVSFFFSQSAFSTASTVQGSLCGFVTGIYIPIGSLSDAVQWVIKLFPISHASALMRQIMTKAAIRESFAEVPERYVSDFKEEVGITFAYGKTAAPPPALHITVLILTVVVFFLLALWNMERQSRRLGDC